MDHTRNKGSMPETEEDPALFEPDESFWEEDEDDDENESPPPRLWIRRTVAWFIVIALLGNVLAFWPQVYSWQNIKFLIVSNTLSKDETIRQYKDAVVTVGAGSSKGTGFHISGGYIITNDHVVGDETIVLVKFAHEKSSQRAEVIGSDPAIDIAVLKIPEQDEPLPSLDLAREWATDKPVHVIGNPLFFQRIVNKGDIIGLTTLAGWDQPVVVMNAPIYGGNSGSPVISDQGTVVAVVFATQRIQHEGKSLNAGLAIPVEYVQRYLNELTQ